MVDVSDDYAETLQMEGEEDSDVEPDLVASGPISVTSFEDIRVEAGGPVCLTLNYLNRDVFAY